jgi:hypothetical protein
MDPTSFLIPDLMRKVLKGPHQNPITPSDSHSSLEFHSSEDDIGIIHPKSLEYVFLRSEDFNVPPE